MKTYDGLNHSYGTHIVKVTVQDDTYTGSFTIEVGGNCKGMNVLSFDISDYDADDIKRFVCDVGTKVRRVEDEEWLRVILIDDNGDTCEYELQDNEFMNMVVGVQIVDFRKGR